METKELIRPTDIHPEAFSSEEATRDFLAPIDRKDHGPKLIKTRRAIASVLMTAGLAAPAINLVSSHDESEKPQQTVSIFTDSQTSSGDVIRDQIEQQAKAAEQKRIEDQRKAEELRKKEQAKKEAEARKENAMVNTLANKADEDSPTKKPELKKNIATIVNSLKERRIATPRVIAYAMATAGRETGHQFRPIEEYGGEQQAIALGYSGGKDYFGRGYVQITHDYNYEKFGKEIGMGDKLVNNPDLALKPNVAGDILAAFFTENDVAQKAEKDFVEARQPVNGSDHAQEIANEANEYLQAIKNA